MCRARRTRDSIKSCGSAAMVYIYNRSTLLPLLRSGRSNVTCRASNELTEQQTTSDGTCRSFNAFNIRH